MSDLSPKCAQKRTSGDHTVLAASHLEDKVTFIPE
jgi:hypothetical protein